MGLPDKSYKRFENPNFGQSFSVAIEGLLYAIKNERNIRYHCFSMILVVLSGVYFQITQTEWLVVILTVSMVIAIELINTAIEAVVDLVMGTRLDPLAKIAKDVSAGAVLVTAFAAMIIGLIVFGPYALALF